MTKVEVVLNACECGHDPQMALAPDKSKPGYWLHWVKCDHCRDEGRQARTTEQAVVNWNMFRSVMPDDERNAHASAKLRLEAAKLELETERLRNDRTKSVRFLATEERAGWGEAKVQEELQKILRKAFVDLFGEMYKAKPAEPEAPIPPQPCSEPCTGIGSVRTSAAVADVPEPAPITNTPPPRPRPFDLEAAKRGEPIMTRDGRKARFIAHVPENEEWRVIVFIEGEKNVSMRRECGSYSGLAHNPHSCDLFMAPRKRSGFVNIYRIGTNAKSSYNIYDSPESCERGAATGQGAPVAMGVPIEWEE